MNKEQEYKKEFGKALRKFRIEKTKKSLRMFAYEYDIPIATLSRIENGIRDAQLTTLKRISEGFGLSLSNFICEIEKKIHKNIILKDE